MTDVDFPDALPSGARLHWYLIERVLGQGGFGITYLARDTNLDRPVAIKEYLPAEIARRRSDASAKPHTESQAERYAWGLERFLAEARTLARFDHPNIVRVLSVFEANNTAYMVMRFEEGEDLATQLDRRGTLPEKQLTDCLLPILDGLQHVHAAGFIHRDIKPENIYVRQDGSPVLLDFGSARQSFGSAKTMTILVAPGYAPLEQYYGDAATQGPWTDIYGLGATCYRAIAGQAPLDAVARAKGVLGSAREILRPATEAGRGRYRESLLAAVDHSLQLSEGDRPQSIAEWRRELSATAATSTVSEVVASAPPSDLAPPAVATPVTVPSAPRKRSPAFGLAVAACALAVALLGYGLFVRKPASIDTTSAAVPTLSPPPAGPPASMAMVAPAVTESPVPVPAPPPSSTPVALPGAAPMLAAAAPKVVEKAEAPARSAPLVRLTPVSVTPSQQTQSAKRQPAEPERGAAQTPASIRAQPPPASLGADPAVVPAASPAAVAPSVVAPVVVAAASAVRETPTRTARDTQIDAAEAALRRGDTEAAAQALAPLAAAGVPRAQALLGRAREARANGQNDFEAYVWYGIAARNGQTGALAQRDKVGAHLQPAEIRQAEQIIERWKPRPEPASPSVSERAAP